MAVAMQDDWRYCNKCCGLWYAGNAEAGRFGVCPAGGGHSGQGLSGNYSLQGDSSDMA
jgi:hypothetical protein